MSTVAVIDLMARWQERINTAAAVSSLAPGAKQRLANALQGVIDALQGMKTRQEDAALLLADQTRSAKYRLDTCQAMRESAAREAQNALDDLRSVADEVKAAVTSAWMPKKPAGVDSVTVIDRKGDVQALLGAYSAPDKILEAAGKLLSDALLKGDADSMLTAYVIASGPLDLFYQAHGCTPEMQAAQFAAAVGKRTSPDGSVLKGAELAPLVEGGAGTLQGFISTTRSEITSATESMRQMYANYVTILSSQLR